MSMSNHEQNQFELLTQMFASDDPVLSRKLAKRAKASEMAVIAPEDVRMMAYGGIIISLLLSFSAFVGAGNMGTLVFSFFLSLFSVSLIMRYKGVSSEAREREYSDG